MMSAVLAAQPAWADGRGSILLASGNDENGPVVAILKPNYSDQLKGRVQVLIAVKTRRYSPKTVEMFVDDKSATNGPINLDSLTLPSAAFNWDTSGFKDGPHRLTVRVTDTQGFRGQADVVVYINNNKELPSSPPGLQWMNVQAGDVLRGEVKIQLQAVNKFGIKYIYVALNPAHTPGLKPPMRSWLINRPPYEVLLNTRRLGDGSYVLNATAWDPWDQEGYAPGLPIIIGNLLPTPIIPSAPRNAAPAGPKSLPNSKTPADPLLPVAPAPSGPIPEPGTQLASPPATSATGPLAEGAPAPGATQPDPGTPVAGTPATEAPTEVIPTTPEVDANGVPQDVPGSSQDNGPATPQIGSGTTGIAPPATAGMRGNRSQTGTLRPNQQIARGQRAPAAPPATTTVPLQPQGVISTPGPLSSSNVRERQMALQAALPRTERKQPAVSESSVSHQPVGASEQIKEWAGSIVYKPLPRPEVSAQRTARSDAGRATAPAAINRPTNPVLAMTPPAKPAGVALTHTTDETVAPRLVRPGLPPAQKMARLDNAGRVLAPVAGPRSFDTVPSTGPHLSQGSGAMAKTQISRNPAVGTVLERIIASRPSGPDDKGVTAPAPGTEQAPGMGSLPETSSNAADAAAQRVTKPDLFSVLPKFPSPNLKSPVAPITVSPIANWSMRATNLPAVHTTQRDETLKAIAARYGVPAPVLASANKLKPWSQVRQGTTIHMPKALLVTFGGKPVTGDVASFMMGSTGVTPFRFLFQKQGGTLLWDQKNWRVTARNGAHEVNLTIGSRTAIVNREEVMMDLAAFLCSGRTMVPVRFFEQALHAQVEWEPSTGRLYVAASN